MPFLTIPSLLTEHYRSKDRIIRRPFPINMVLSMSDWNESRQTPEEEKFVARLRRREIKDGEVFTGIAGLKSLDLLAVIGSENHHTYRKAVLFDFNEQQLSVMQEILRLMRENVTPEAFIKQFSQEYPNYFKMPKGLHRKRKENFFTAFGSSYMPPPEQLEPILERAARFPKSPGSEPSWLEPENYKTIREMAVTDDIALVNVDMRDSRRMQILKGWLEAQQLMPGDMYLSSSLDFVDPNVKTDYYGKGGKHRLKEARNFYDNLLMLTDPQTHFLISVPDPEHSILHSYSMQALRRHDVEQRKAALHEGHWRQKRCSIPFSAGGQEWRLNSFESANGRYFRIFTEMPPGNFGKIQVELQRINQMLQDQEKAQDIRIIPPTEYPKSADDDPAFFNNVAFFENEKHLPPNHQRYALFSSEPFRYGEHAYEATLDCLVDGVRHIFANQSRALE